MNKKKGKYMSNTKAMTPKYKQNSFHSHGLSIKHACIWQFDESGSSERTEMKY